MKQLEQADRQTDGQNHILSQADDLTENANNKRKESNST